MTRQNIHVAIIGAGLGGLCLGQGLQKQGISFDIYERDVSADSRTQGYRIRIDETGQRALVACLPADLDRLFRHTCARSRSPGQFLDTQLGPVGGRPSESWRPSAVTGADTTADEAGDLSANRLTLREILLSGIRDRVHFGKAFNRFYEAEHGGLGILFHGGHTCTADILVAADGVNSAVRRQRLPLAEPVDTGSVCIYGKTIHVPGSAVADTLLSGTSVIFADDFAVIVDAMSFGFPHGARLTPVADYVYWAVIGRGAALGLTDGAIQQAGGTTLLAKIKRLAAPWKEGLRALFTEADRTTVAVLPIRSAERLVPWSSNAVTVLGDAIHAMSPAGGLGANTALEDASCLAGHLARARAGASSLQDAIAAYEDDMRRRANAAVEASMQGAGSLFRDPPPTRHSAGVSR